MSSPFRKLTCQYLAYIPEAIHLFYDQECSYICNKLHRIAEYQNGQHCSEYTVCVALSTSPKEIYSFNFILKTLLFINLFMGYNSTLSEMNFKKCSLTRTYNIIIIIIIIIVLWVSFSQH